VKNYLDVVIGVCAIVGIIWRLALVKAEIEKEYERLKDYLDDKIIKTENELKIHLTEYEGKKELLEYQLSGINQKLDHKFNRCWAEIKQQQAFLVKQGFVPREDNTL
jgi:hypothetical protein